MSLKKFMKDYDEVAMDGARRPSGRSNPDAENGPKWSSRRKMKKAMDAMSNYPVPKRPIERRDPYKD